MKLSKLIAAIAVAGTAAVAVHATSGNQVKPSKPAYAVPANLGAPMGKAERVQLIKDIARRWSGYVREVRNVDPVAWGRSMAATFAKADPANLRRAAAMGTYEGMIATVLGYPTTDNAVIDQLARANSAAALAALGSPSNDLVYTVITPCRILDTRATYEGRMTADSLRDFEASRPGGSFASQGGSDTDCGIPADPAAVVMNLTVVQPDGPGYVTLFPYGQTKPLSSSVNNVFGSDVGNETVVKLTVGAEADFSAYSYTGTDLVADAVGYFAAPVATAVDCITANGTQSQVAAGATFSLTATCPAGYAVAGGGVRSPGGNTGLTTSESYPQGGTAWFVNGKNTSGVSDTLQARANCCRVPGR